MPPDQLAGLARFWVDYSTAATVILLIACIGIAAVVWGFIRVFSELRVAIQDIGTIAAAHRAADGNVIQHHEHNARMRETLAEIKTLLETYDETARDHYDDVARLTNEEHWKNCPIDRCPNFPRILGSYQELVTKFELFEVLATEARNRTNENLEKLAGELHALALEMLAILRSFGEPTEKRGDKA